MITSTLAIVQSAGPSTVEWNIFVGIVMILCNLFAIFIGYFAIQNTGKGPNLPIPQLSSKKSFGVPEILATTSFGHILGAGIILGLSNAGIL